MKIRAATSDDAAGIAAVYEPYIRKSPATFHTEVPSPAEDYQSLVMRLARYPVLVAEDQETIVGYAHASAHSPRPAYRWSVDTSIYLTDAYQRRGLGRHLYRSLLTILRELNYRMAYAGITLPNIASVSLHESTGFQFVGTFPEAGFKFDAWRDVGWWYLDLRPEWSTSGPTAEPMLFHGSMFEAHDFDGRS